MASRNSALVQQQADFTVAVAKLILVAKAQHVTVTLREVYRPGWLARLYARLGSGIRNSQHTDGLAVDLALYISGVYQTKSAAYARLGAAWEEADNRARWGGDFTKPDGNHFEFIDP